MREFVIMTKKADRHNADLPFCVSKLLNFRKRNMIICRIALRCTARGGIYGKIFVPRENILFHYGGRAHRTAFQCGAVIEYVRFHRLHAAGHNNGFQRRTFFKRALFEGFHALADCQRLGGDRKSVV